MHIEDADRAVAEIDNAMLEQQSQWAKIQRDPEEWQAILSHLSGLTHLHLLNRKHKSRNLDHFRWHSRLSRDALIQQAACIIHAIIDFDATYQHCEYAFVDRQELAP